MKIEIDHVGYAVKDIETAIAAFQQLGYRFGKPITDNMHHVMAVMGSLRSLKVELLMPIMGGYCTSPIDNYLKKIGNTPYHICYKVDNIDRAIHTLRVQKFLLVVRPSYYELLDSVAAFMFSVETGLIELVQCETIDGEEWKSE